MNHTEQLEALRALPLPKGAAFSIKEVTTVNHKPHPYTIGLQHIRESSGVIGSDLCRRVPCAYPDCSVPYEGHTSETAAVVEVSTDAELKDVPHLQEFLVTIKEKAAAAGVDGFVFVRAPKGYTPKDSERIQLVEPTGSTEPSKVTRQQYKSFGPRPVEGYGKNAAIWAHVRYDDECGNGHNSFAITGTVRVGGRREPVACGCLHEDIALAFPELAPFIKWHSCDSNGPMHYLSNTLYNAGDRDCWGKRKGEPRAWEQSVQFGENPIRHKIKASFAKFLQENARGFEGAYDFEVIAIEHENRAGDSYKFEPKYTFGGYASKWHECPFDTEDEALRFLAALQTCQPKFIQVPTLFGEGKERDFDAARRSAVWPEATDAELMADDLKERLEARLPALLLEFRRDMERLGFVW